MDNKFDEKLENFLNEIDIYNNDRSGKEFIENYHKNKIFLTKIIFTILWK